MNEQKNMYTKMRMMFWFLCIQLNKDFLKINNNNAGNGTVGWTLLMNHYEVAQVSEGNFALCIKALNCPHFVT